MLGPLPCDPRPARRVVGYTPVPAEGCAWWDALPLRLTGEWPVRGGVMRWMPYGRAIP